jgi:hypothetical protein
VATPFVKDSGQILCYNIGMTTVTLQLSEDLAERIAHVGDRLPDLLTFALDTAGIPGNGGNQAQVTQMFPAWLETVDFLAQSPTRREIIDFKLSPESQSRVEVLLDASRRRELSPQEQAELQTYQQIYHLFILLKARARTTAANAA